MGRDAINGVNSVNRGRSGGRRRGEEEKRKRNEESASAGYAVAACDYACGTRDSGAKASTRCT